MSAVVSGTFADGILAAAARDPGAPAVVTPGGVLSYGELAGRIDRLARALVAQGAGPERVCAVAVERGADAVVATAAVARAGAAFLTLDMDLPPARLAAMVRGAGASLLLAGAALADRCAALPVDGPTVPVDVPGPGEGAGAPAPEGPRADPRSLAYVSHTSGSTGTPNAVLVEHAGLGSYLRFVVRDYGLGPHTTAVQLAPLGYDASIRDTFAPLLAGGRLVVLPRATLLRADEFAAAVRAYGIDTVLSTTPSFLTFLAGSPGAADGLRGLRLVVSSGESLRPFLAAGGRRALPGRLVNQYGPTECTMTSTRLHVPDAPETGADLVGTPIDGVAVHLLGADLSPVPDGAVGEAWIAGVGVARGYGGRPALTAERFVPDPAGPPGARMYRTGDLARRRADGGLEYLGRVDRQVKVRGHRVDPAEVEGALLAHPAVAGAVVTAATDDRGRTYLVAHVAGGPAGGLAGTTDPQLRAHLAATLPPHMMPRRFVRIDRVPTTASGKADRTALAGAAPSPSGGPR